ARPAGRDPASRAGSAGRRATPSGRSTQTGSTVRSPSTARPDRGRGVVAVADLTPEQLHALDIARELVKAGVPVFVAPPCPGANCDRRGHNSGRTEFHLPARWQTSTPNLDVVDR